MHVLFPAQERQFPGLRWIRITLRTAHIVSFTAVVGGHIFGAAAADVLPWLIATIATGAGIMALYLFQSFRWLCELRGAAILFKLLLLCVIPFWWEARVPILVAIVVISSYVSHMPGRYRYRVIRGGPNRQS